MKNKKNIVIISIIGVVGLALVTFAYFSSTSVLDNLFSTADYGTTINEEFVSPANWVPGAVEQKRVYVTNTGEVPVAVRISYTESWTSANGDNLDLTFTKQGQSIPAAILAFGDNFLQNWVKSTENGVDYYYYNTILDAGESTTDFLKSVTFNENVTSEANCENTNIYDQNTGDLTGVEQTCTSGDGYDGGTYNLTLTIQTVQSSVYKTVWNTNYDIGTPIIIPTGVQYLTDNAINNQDASYNSVTKGNMFTFSHAATDQTEAVTDYRYIGDKPNNYIKFNCDNNGLNCEIWRIVGIFPVERPDPEDNTQTITENRIKIVRNSSFSENLYWDSNKVNDWTNASLNTYLNGDYYNRTGDAETFGLTASARSMIDDAVFYLGATSIDENTHYGSAEDIYTWERGNILCGSCGSDTTKLSDTNKIGLLYPSDAYMIYGKGVENTCYNDPKNCTINNSAEPTISWLYNSNIKEGSFKIDKTLLLSPLSSLNDILYMYEYGYLNSYGQQWPTTVRPTLYLKSDIYIVGGNGRIENPYQVSASYQQNTSNSTHTYTSYSIGDRVEFDNQYYRVLENSDASQGYLTLLKEELLTASEVNSYNGSYNSTNGEYPYYEATNCKDGNTSECYTDYYYHSFIKNIVDNWASQYDNVLVNVNGYKARLITKEEITENLGFSSYYDSPNTHYSLTQDTFTWAYIGGKPYWTMSQPQSIQNKVVTVSNNPTPEFVYNKAYIRPVININKCAITGGCQ